LTKENDEKQRSQPEAQKQKELEEVWNDIAHLIGLLEQMF
jgi:hypothetical protein